MVCLRFAGTFSFHCPGGGGGSGGGGEGGEHWCGRSCLYSFNPPQRGGWVAFVLVFKPFCKQFYLWSANTVLIEVNEDWKCVAANICRSID